MILVEANQCFAVYTQMQPMNLFDENISAHPVVGKELLFPAITLDFRVTSGHTFPQTWETNTQDLRSRSNQQLNNINMNVLRISQAGYV
jgi:hypothetical protein